MLPRIAVRVDWWSTDVTANDAHSRREPYSTASVIPFAVVVVFGNEVKM